MDLQRILLTQFNATQAQVIETIQTLWSGYGSIIRYALIDQHGMPCTPATIIIKSIRAPEMPVHPRGWDSDHSQQRKLKSYQVESHWYKHWSSQCPVDSPVAHCYGVYHHSPSTASSETYILLEDLDARGFNERADHLNPEQAKVCLDWLAYFHAQFIDDRQSPTTSIEWPQGLWQTGTYWHLATRHEEYAVMKDCPLKGHAHDIDRQLNNCRFQSLVHGDAKVANFCFTPGKLKVAAVDFQYVGGGCGMKDVAYFLGSCLSEMDCEDHSNHLLDGYFTALATAIHTQTPCSPINTADLETEWRSLFSFAWADFQRFILGWSPQHSKNNTFSKKMARKVIKTIEQTKINPLK